MEQDTMSNIIDVYSESGKRRAYVGCLTRVKSGYIFQYSLEWLEYDKSFQLGDDIPLGSETLKFKKFPKSLLDRIPPKSSTNYKRYCSERGISTSENDKMILLGTIGHKGASSFVFELSDKLDRKNMVLEKLSSLMQRFTLRDLACLFGVSHGSIQRVFKGDASGAIYSLLEITLLNRQAFLFRVEIARTLTDKMRNDFFCWGMKSIEADYQRSIRSDSLVEKT